MNTWKQLKSRKEQLMKRLIGFFTIGGIDVRHDVGDGMLFRLRFLGRR